MKSVAVILPNYNYAQYFSERLDGILSQTYPVSEIIVLDDGSTDNSRQVIKEKLIKVEKKYPHLKIKTNFSSRNSGSVFRQWRKGIELAESEYIWICELDDLCAKTFLETAMKGFSNSNVILSYTNSKFITKNNSLEPKSELRRIKNFFRENRPKTAYTRSGKEELAKVLVHYNTIPNISAVVFKKIPDIDYSEILRTSSTFHLSGDWYFYSELLLHGDISYSPKRLNLHRLHDDSVTSQTDDQLRLTEARRIRLKITKSLGHNNV